MEEKIPEINELLALAIQLNMEPDYNVNFGFLGHTNHLELRIFKGGYLSDATIFKRSVFADMNYSHLSSNGYCINFESFYNECKTELERLIEELKN